MMDLLYSMNVSEGNLGMDICMSRKWVSQMTYYIYYPFLSVVLLHAMCMMLKLGLGSIDYIMNGHEVGNHCILHRL